MPFAILVIGSPGSGKSTFCHGLQQLYSQTKQKAVFVNLDPANHSTPFQADYDVCDLVSFHTVCQQEKIGPNGALLRCMEILEKTKLDQIKNDLIQFDSESLFIFDCPGQVELHTMHSSLINIINSLHDFRFAVANVVDSCKCLDKYGFVSAALITLQSMLHFGLAQINFMSKLDLLLPLTSTPLDHPLAVYCNAELSLLISGEDGTADSLTRSICELIEEQSQIYFTPIAVEDKESMMFAAQELNRVVGRIFGGFSEDNACIMEAAYSSKTLEEYVELMQERYLCLTTNED